METMLCTIYWIGVVLCPILFGMFMGRKIKKNMMSLWDVYIPLGFISFLWPILLILVAFVCLVILLGEVIGVLWILLSEIGRFVGRKIGIDNDDELENEDE